MLESSELASAESSCEGEIPLRWQAFLVVACFCHAASTLLASDLIHQSGGNWW
ncbi:hypothetical protein [Adhaeretor mobilis]|uniref:Uncharacterized protein n=1 Tax=Adhaeretor mobilis TaxID=1930276 RepID=A0A517MVT8_9BACT|nr:hypothetical protein [Adhaeretor mobilis]QDS98990.1 hypothetical protein HG15A2_22790 [Adhaeretor mobilis]